MKNKPITAGKILANITADRSALKFPAAIMVFGLGDMIFPHLPPPIIAISNTDGDRFRRLPIERATGATVITATSIKTPHHPMDYLERRGSKEYAYPVTIGEDCWIGGGAIICPGVTIGNRCVIGAGSVVTKDIPDDSVAVGNPARVVRKQVV